MGQMGWNIKRSGDTLIVEMLEDQKSLGYVAMTATETDDTIKHLAGFRAEMTPEIPRDVPKPPISGPQNPYMAVFDVPVLPGKVLAIRHPGLGWLSFSLPQKVANGLADGLRGQSPLSPFLNVGGQAN